MRLTNSLFCCTDGSYTIPNDPIQFGPDANTAPGSTSRLFPMETRSLDANTSFVISAVSGGPKVTLYYTLQSPFDAGFNPSTAVWLAHDQLHNLDLSAGAVFDGNFVQRVACLKLVCDAGSPAGAARCDFIASPGTGR